VDHYSGVQRKLPDRSEPTYERALRECVDPKVDFLPLLHPSDVPLVYTEIELQRIGSPQGEKEITFIQGSAEPFGQTRSKHHSGTGRSDRGVSHLFI
jgi:hypothetical protein